MRARAMRYPKKRQDGAPMKIEISQETEALLAAKARHERLSVDALLQRPLNDTGPTQTNGSDREIAGVPTWPLGAHGTFHRTDI